MFTQNVIMKYIKLNAVYKTVDTKEIGDIKINFEIIMQKYGQEVMFLKISVI